MRKPVPRYTLLVGMLGVLWGCGEDPADRPARTKPAAPKPATAVQPNAPPSAATAAPGVQGTPGTAGTPSVPGAAGTPGAPAAPVAAAPEPPPPPGREGVIYLAHRRSFKPEDFVATPVINTDPFHSNLALFSQVAAPDTERKLPANTKSPKFTLEELKLTAIIIASSDGGSNRAMFIEPTGLGVSVVRGDRLSKAGALVNRVLSDRVLFEFTEEITPGKRRALIRAVEIRPTETPGGTVAAAGAAPAAPVAAPAALPILPTPNAPQIPAGGTSQRPAAVPAPVGAQAPQPNPPGAPPPQVSVPSLPNPSAPQPAAPK